MSLQSFLPTGDTVEYSLVVVNREAPRPIQTILEDTFERQPVDVTETDLRDAVDADTVHLVDTTGDVLASSPLSALEETILLVNSDLYKTGTQDFTTFELPDVLRALDGVPFRLRGYPHSDNEKLLLIAVSRSIERRAWQAGTGTVRASFQHLSRIDDEQGTRTVYETLGDSGVQTHVYGVPDWVPPETFGVVTHGGYTDDFYDSWFVVYTPDTDADDPVGLLAIEVAPREWAGFWTFDPERVAAIDRYIAENL